MPVLGGGGGVDPTDVVGRRVAAWFVDGILTYALAVALIYAFGIPQALEQQVERHPNQPDPGVASGFLTALLVVSLLIFVLRVLLVGTLGWTPGKLFLGLRVVRYDGRPPGLGKAFVRCLVDGLGEGLFGCLYLIPALIMALNSTGHRQPADAAANTYVIDASYLGRLLMHQGERLVAGPRSVHREEVQELLQAQGNVAPVTIPANGLITEPFYDKGLGTHVVFSKKQDRWLRFDARRGTWEPLEEVRGGGAP